MLEGILITALICAGAFVFGYVCQHFEPKIMGYVICAALGLSQIIVSPVVWLLRIGDRRRAAAQQKWIDYMRQSFHNQERERVLTGRVRATVGGPVREVEWRTRRIEKPVQLKQSLEGWEEYLKEA